VSTAGYVSVAFSIKEERRTQQGGALNGVVVRSKDSSNGVSGVMKGVPLQGVEKELGKEANAVSLQSAVTYH
jgi:hypothetical protein